MKRILPGLLALLLLCAACATSTAPMAASTEAAMESTEIGDMAAPASSDADASAEKMIEAWTVSMETEAFEATFQTLQELIAKYDAYTDAAEISNENLYAEKAHRYARFLIRVEADKTQPLLQEIRNAGHVVSETLNKENVTEQVQDLQSRREMLQAKEDRLNELLARAETIEDLITIEGHLSETIAQKEQILSSLEKLNRDVSRQFIEVSVREVSDYTPVETAATSFPTRLKDAFSSTLSGFVRLVENFVLALVYALPYLLLLALVAGIGAILLRKRRSALKRLPVTKKDAHTD